MRVCVNSVNGWLTGMGATAHASYDVAKPYTSENNAWNSWNVNFDSGNVNNWNNKYNDNYVRPCTEYTEFYYLLMSVFEAYEDCLKGKRSSSQALEYMPMAAEDLPKLAYEIWARVYTPSPSTCFMVTFPKLREVFAAALRDRVIHHWICIRLLPLFEERCYELGNVSHACRKGYGTKTAIAQVQEGMIRVSDHLQKEAWIYKGDIVGFFMNISKTILWDMLEDLIKRKYVGEDMDTLLYLVKVIVFHHPEKCCTIQSPIEMWQYISKDKSLFYIDDDLGMPIGNLTTQLFAGYYNSFLDEFVEELFRGKNYSYTRSVDDFVIICDDRVFLRHAIRQIADFTSAQLGLECHKDKIYFQPVSHGVKFLGMYVYAYRKYTINRTIGRFIDRVNLCISECKAGMTEIRAEYWSHVFNSYFGFLVQGNGYRKRTEIFKMLPHAWYIYFNLTNRRKVTIKRRYRYDKCN